MAAYTLGEVEVSITDECIAPVGYEKDMGLVGLTAYTNTAPRAYEIAAAFRQRGVPVVMGGIHASK